MEVQPNTNIDIKNKFISRNYRIFEKLNQEFNKLYEKEIIKYILNNLPLIN